MFNWTLYILDPLLILIGGFFLWKFINREKEGKGLVLFYVESLLIWIVNTILVRSFSLNFELKTTINPTLLILLTFFASVTLLTIVLKPLATFLTGRLEHRRYWMWAAIGATVLSLVLAEVFAGRQQPIIILVLGAILLAFSMSSQTLYYLFANEQFYYRTAPIFSSIKIGSTTALATFIGTFMFGFNAAVQGAAVPRVTLHYHALLTICLGFTFISLGLSFFKKEASNYVKSFEPKFLRQIQPYNAKILFF